MKSFRIFESLFEWLLLSPLLFLPMLVMAQDSAELYNARCAACHEAPANEAVRAPARSVLAEQPPETIYRVLTQGVMRIQASGLTNMQMQSLSEYISGRPMSELNLTMTTNLCADNPRMGNPVLGAGLEWLGQ